MTSSELDSLLEFSEERNADFKTILTLNARHMNAFAILEEYVEIIGEHGNAGLCFVAGNPVYLSDEEKQIDAKLRIRELVTSARRTLPSVPIFVGSEGQLELTMELAAEHSTIPFMLMNRSAESQSSALLSNSGCNELALYCPYLLSEEDDAELLIHTLGQYAVRRKWVRHALRRAGFRHSQVLAQIQEGHSLEEHAKRILIDSIRKLAICNIADLRETLQRFSTMGVRYVAFLQATEGSDGDARLMETLSNARKEGL